MPLGSCCKQGILTYRGKHQRQRACMLQGLQRLQNVNAQNDGINYRNAMGVIFSTAPDRWLGPGGPVHFEQKYCISCYYHVRSSNSAQASASPYSRLSVCVAIPREPNIHHEPLCMVTCFH